MFRSLTPRRSESAQYPRQVYSAPTSASQLGDCGTGGKPGVAAPVLGRRRQVRDAGEVGVPFGAAGEVLAEEEGVRQAAARCTPDGWRSGPRIPPPATRRMTWRRANVGSLGSQIGDAALACTTVDGPPGGYERPRQRLAARERDGEIERVVAGTERRRPRLRAVPGERNSSRRRGWSRSARCRCGSRTGRANDPSPWSSTHSSRGMIGALPGAHDGVVEVRQERIDAREDRVVLAEQAGPETDAREVVLRPFRSTSSGPPESPAQVLADGAMPSVLSRLARIAGSRMPGLGSSAWKSASVGVPRIFTLALRLMPTPSTSVMSAVSALLPPQPAISPFLSALVTGVRSSGIGSKGSARSRCRIARSG